LGRECFLWEAKLVPDGEKACFLRMVFPREQKKPLDGEKVGFLGKVGLLWKKPLSKEKVGSPERESPLRN
jgi:hypothetical protein